MCWIKTEHHLSAFTGTVCGCQKARRQRHTSEGGPLLFIAVAIRTAPLRRIRVGNLSHVRPYSLQSTLMPIEFHVVDDSQEIGFCVPGIANAHSSGREVR